MAQLWDGLGAWKLVIGEWPAEGGWVLGHTLWHCCTGWAGGAEAGFGEWPEGGAAQEDNEAAAVCSERNKRVLSCFMLLPSIRARRLTACPLGCSCGHTFLARLLWFTQMAGTSAGRLEQRSLRPRDYQR